MSVFRPIDVTCPACRKRFAFEAVYSVNADRRPALRDAILDGTFQRLTCPACSASSRLDPEFTYLNQQRGLWVAAFSATALGQWADAEQDAQATFDESFGAGAPEAARTIGNELTRRVTFGWPALREKLFLREKNLDDVSVELMKSALLRSGGVPLDGDIELRVLDVNEATFACAWLRVATGQVFELIEAPRALYDSIVADSEPWEDLRADLTQGEFVDLNRLLVPSEPAPA
jgi:hypothetical protein